VADRLYFQVDAHWYEHRKVRKVGALGWILFQYLLAKHRVNPALGWVDPSDAHPEQIACTIGPLLPSPQEDPVGLVESLLKVCQGARLIERDEETGAVFICGWEDWHGPRTATERSRRHRDRIRGTDCEDKDLGRNGQPVDGTALHRVASVASRCARSPLSPLLSSRLSDDDDDGGVPSGEVSRSPLRGVPKTVRSTPGGAA
jgi:hypothetical protein